MATRKRGQLIDGVLLLDKSDGMSSNHALQRARRTLDARKAGHTGTLDPFATGLLVCCFGRATKISATMLEADKAYEATLQFGQETDSGDLTGNVVSQAPAEFAGVTLEALGAVLPAFRGPITQVPPMYSALKRDGKPLYEYARQGIELEREARHLVIHDLQVQDFTPLSARLFVRCSKGTYIRTLAQDIGRALGCFAHLTALRRTELGPFHIDDAYTLDGLQAMEDPMSALLAIESLPTEILPKKLQSEG
jgi:tRNA pseudouridine55 synthase